MHKQSAQGDGFIHITANPYFTNSGDYDISTNVGYFLSLAKVIPENFKLPSSSYFFEKK